MPPQTETQKQKAQAGAQGLGFSSVEAAREAISTDSLNDVSTIKTTPPKESTQATGLLGALETQATDASTLQAQADTLAQDKQTSLDSYLTNLLESPTESQLTNQANKEAGVNDIQKELDDINQEIRMEQRGLTNQITRLEKRAAQEGGLASALQDKIDDAERESLRKQADLSVIQMGIQGRFNSAKSIADRAVQAQLEKQRNVNEALLFNYQENKDLFTTADQRAFETAQSERERALDKEEADLQAISDLSLAAMEQGAPASVVRAIRSAKTVEAAQEAAAEFLAPRIEEERQLDMQSKDLDRQIKEAQLNKLTASDNSGIDWGQRANIIKLASEGDPLAIKSLGYDPRQKGLTPDQIMESERKQAEATTSISMIDDMLENSRGIGAITGQVKSPTISGFFMGGKSDGSASSLVSKVPVVGNIQGAIQSRNDRDRILTDLQNLYNTEGFQEFIGLKQSGLTFGSLSDSERQSIFSSANRLNSGLVLQTTSEGSSGRVEGYQGSAESLRKDLAEVQKGLKARNEEIATRLLLDPTEMQEIIDL